MKQISLLLALLTGAVVLAGCTGEEAGDTTSATSSTSDVTADQDFTFDDFEDEDFEEETEVVDEDVFGTDLETVERYPNSIRSYYESYEGEISLTYQTTDDQEEVRSHFSDILTADGWGLDAEATDYMEYSRNADEGEEYMSLYFYPYPSQGITEYELYYEPPYDESDDDDFADDDDSLIFE